MATDVKKVVEIELKVTGLDTKALTGIISKFGDLAEAVRGVSVAVKGMQNSFEKIKIPAPLTTAVSSLKELSSITKFPNLKTLAEGFERLVKVGKIPDFSKLEKELKKLDGIKLPNIKNISTGLRELIKINTTTSASQLRALSDAMRGFEDVKLPGITAFANGLRKLITVDTQKIVSQLYKLHSAFNKLAQNEAVIVGLGRIVSSMKKTEQATKALAETTKTQVSKISMWMDKIGSYMTYRLIADSIRMLSDSVRSGISAIIEYSQALKDLQAITGASSRDVEMMGTMVKQVATTTKFSASEVAAGMRTLGQAGLSAVESTKTMQAVADLATGTLSDMAGTVDLVTTAMRVFGIEAVDSGMIADTFANAVNRSKLTIDKLRISFNYVGPIAKEAGLSFQETGAALMALANSGLRASTIGTGLRRMLAELVDPNKKLAEAAMEAGISLDQLNPTKNDLGGVLEALGVVINDTATAFDIFGKRGAAAALAITNTESGYNSLYATIQRTGTAAKMAETQMQGLGVSFKNLKDKLGLLAIALGEAGITAALKVFVDVARSVVDVITTLTESVFGGFIVKLGIAVGVVGAFTAAVLAAKAALAAFHASAAFAQLASWALGVTSTTTTVTGLTAVMGDFGVVATLVGTKIKALALALKGLVLSNPYLAALTAALVVAAAAFDLFSTSAVEAAEASDEAHKSFAELDTKLGVLDSYKDKVAGLSNSSDEFRQENLKLRDSLGDVIAEYGELYTEAVAASDSINIITGEITDSGTAIAAYAIELEKLRIEKLQQSISSLNTALKETTGNIERASGSFNRMWNAIKNVVSWLGKLPAAFLAFLLPGVSGTEALTEALDELISKSSDAGNASELGKAFLDAIEHGNVSIEKMREMKAQLEEIGTRVDLPKNIELAITKFDELGTQVDTILTDMIQKEGFDFQLMTDEEVAIALDNLGYMENKTELFTKTVQLRVTEIKESFRSLTKSWREDLKSEQFQLKDLLSAEGYTEILNSAIGDVGVFVNAITTANEDEIAGHLKAKQALLDKQDVARAVFAASAKSAEDTTKLVILEKQYAEEAAQIHADLFKNEAVYQQKRLMDVANTANAEIKALEIKYKGVVNGEKKIASETVRIKRKLAQEVASITALTYTPKEAMIQFKLDSEERKKAHTQTLFDISMAEAKGVIDHEQAEQQKLDATLDSLAEQARASKKIAEDMAIHAPGSAATAEKQRIADAEKYQAAKLKKVEHYNKEYLRLTKKLADDVKKVEDEGAKNTKTVTDFKIAAGEADIAAEEEYIKKKETINATLNDKLASIYEKYYEKLDDLRQASVDAEKKAAADIAGVSDSLNDKIRGIRQRGMTDEQKNVDNRITADQKLAAGIEEIEKARKTGDEAALARGEKLIQQSSSLFEGLADPDIAIAGVQKAAEIEKEIIATTLKLEQDKIAEKKEAALIELEDGKKQATEKHTYDMKLEAESHTEKLKNIADKLKVDLGAEAVRHKKVMDNLKNEIVEYTKQMKQIKILRDDTAAHTLTTKTDKEVATIGGVGENISLDVVAQKAKNARSEVEQLALTMGLIRREGEEDVAFTLRVRNTDQVDQYIKEFKSQVQIELEDVSPQLTPVLNTDKTDAEITVLLNDLKQLSDTTHEDGMEIRITSDEAVAKIADIQIKLDEMISDAAVLGSEADMIPLVDSFNTIATSGAMSATVVDELANSLLTLNSETNTNIIIDVSVNDDQIAMAVKEVETAVENTDIPISLKPQIVMSPAVDIKTGIKNLITKLKAVEKIEIKIPIYINTETVNELIVALEYLNPNIDITITIYGKEELIEVESIYDLLISKIVTLTAVISGLSKWEKAKSVYDSLKNKTITITTKHVTKRAGGGLIQAFAGGGGVFKRYTDPLIKKGSGYKDDVHALLMKGEYVIRKSAVARVGKDALDAINYGMKIPQFALGGLVPSMPLGTQSSSMLDTAQSMGVVNLELGNKQYPVVGQTDVVNTLIEHLNTERLMRGN